MTPIRRIDTKHTTRTKTQPTEPTTTKRKSHHPSTPPKREKKDTNIKGKGHSEGPHSVGLTRLQKGHKRRQPFDKDIDRSEKGVGDSIIFAPFPSKFVAMVESDEETEEDELGTEEAAERGG